METFISILSLFGGAASGGILGAIGGFIGKFFEHRHQLDLEKVKLEIYKIQTVHDQVMAEKANQTLKIEIEGSLKQATVEATAATTLATYDALKASYENDAATYATGDAVKNSKWFVFVDFCRGITRPFLTWGLTLSMFAITGYLLYILKEQLPYLAEKEGVSLLVYSVHSLAFLASTSIVYWFAGRNTSPK